MTECSAGLPLDDPNRCPGLCCSSISLPFSLQELRALDPDEYGIDPHTYSWATTDLTPLTDEQVEQRAPWSFEAPEGTEIRGYGGRPRHFYSCAHWDTATGLCGIWEDRPPLCDAYPWSRGVPEPNASLPPSCSFWADLGKPIIPVRFLGRLYPGRKVGA